MCTLNPKSPVSARNFNFTPGLIGLEAANNCARRLSLELGQSCTSSSTQAGVPGCPV